MDRADTYINYNIDLEETGKNIRTFLKIAGYSARDMEQYLGCTQMTFFNWQEGKNLPGFDNLLRLAGILKVPMEKIVVFKKRDDGIPLKSSNSGFIRNNVFLLTIMQLKLLYATVFPLTKNSAHSLIK